MPTLEDLMREYKENDEIRKMELKRARKLAIERVDKIVENYTKLQKWINEKYIKE